jgi:polysaccharide biosynthesis protein PslH
VVSTTRGVEGLDAHDGGDVLVADDPAEFAARCSMAARYPDLRDRLVANGRARYEAEFTWQLIGTQLTDWLSEPEKQARPASRT